MLVTISKEIFLKYMLYTEKHIHVYMIFSTIRHLKFNTIVVYSERFFEKFFTKNMLSKFCIENRIRLFNGNFKYILISSSMSFQEQNVFIFRNFENLFNV